MASIYFRIDEIGEKTQLQIKCERNLFSNVMCNEACLRAYDCGGFCNSKNLCLCREKKRTQEDYNGMPTIRRSETILDEEEEEELREHRREYKKLLEESPYYLSPPIMWDNIPEELRKIEANESYVIKINGKKPKIDSNEQ